MAKRNRRTGEGGIGNGAGRLRLQLSTANLPGTLFIVILMICACMFLLSKGLSSLKRAYAEDVSAAPEHLAKPTGHKAPETPLAPEPITDATPSRASKAATDYIILPRQNQP